VFCSPGYHARLVRGLLLFSDYLGSNPAAVMGGGETTAVLYAAARPQRRITRALDLGCGAGTLALLLCEDAECVIGTDINPRAIEFSRLNAEVNGIANVEFRAGDLFEPVRDEQFDLIVSQPPYYPGSGTTFLHGGERGDELPWRVMHGIRDHLAEGGRALVFTSWPEDRGDLRLDGMRVLELRTNRREVHGTRQSISVVEHGSGWYSRVDVPPEAWGEVRSERIEALIAAAELAEKDDRTLLATDLVLPEGVHITEDGLVIGPAESLVNYTVLDRPLDMRNPEQIRAALRRGLLRVLDTAY
jgi:SAM-dependent methyltransferase